MNLLNVSAGFGVGFLVGLTGVGGGALTTPLLVLLFGTAPSVEVGTDLWFASITKFAGGTLHGWRGNVDWQVVRRLWTDSLPASLVTLAWLRQSRDDGAITLALGTVLLATALAMALKSRLHAWGRRLRVGDPGTFKRTQPMATVVAGALLGFLVTFTSVGAGSLGAVLLLALYPLRMVPARLVGTDIVHAVPLTLVAALGHLLLGHVDGRLLISLIAGSLPGIAAGSFASFRLPEPLLRGATALVLLAVGLGLVLPS